jgi:hypothetical protein
MVWRPPLPLPRGYWRLLCGWVRRSEALDISPTVLTFADALVPKFRMRALKPGHHLDALL